jgi:LEA14-like dessication related protein
MKKTLFILAGVGLAYVLYRKFRLQQKANVMFRGLKLGGSLLTPEIQISLAVQNPTNTGTTLKSISADLVINNQYVANFSSFGDQRINPNSESIINLIARPKLVTAIKSLIQIIKGKKQKLQGVITGSANFDGFNVPINQTVSV